MKIIIISDIHGNIAALDAINEKADLVLCLGDVVNYGPYPKECIKRIKNLTDKIVRGNHDNAVGKGMDCRCSAKYKEISDAGKIFTNNILNMSEKKFLSNLPIVLKVEIKGKLFLLSHASPGGDMYKYISPETTDKDLKLEINDIEADVIFIGHTHLPMIREVDGIKIVNPGSVGQPRDGIPMVSYAVWENGKVEIKRVAYNIDAAVKGLQETSIHFNHVKKLSKILMEGGMY